MEVHHHAHAAPHSEASTTSGHRGWKKWSHYLFEFFMLFLAVTAGFLVENMRHHSLEKKYEKQYMKSLVEDLQSDTMQLMGLINLFQTIHQKEDSLKKALKQPGIIKNAVSAYPFLGYPLDGYAFHRSERTIQQLKNAGGLRLIHSVGVSNRINEYDETYRKSDEINRVTIETYHRYTEILNRVADASLIGYPYTDSLRYNISPEWITNDAKDLQILYNYTVNIQWVTGIYRTQLIGLHKQATELILFLKDEYDLQ